MSVSRLALTVAAGALFSTSAAFAGGQCTSAKSVKVAGNQCSSAMPVKVAGNECGSASAQTVAMIATPGDIVETAVQAGSFNTLAAALDAAGLVGALQGEGPFTVFAPTDEAFSKLPEGTVQTLLKPENRGLLTAILTYHVVPGELTAGDVIARTNAATLNGQRVDITVGNGVKIDDANVVKTDILCSNGVIHVIDRVIMPSSDNIIDSAVKSGSFQTLTAAVKAAGLAKTLSGEGPFTVFAPTDAAFAKLPAGTVETLLKPENLDQLQAILKFHVVPGRVYASDALAAETAATVQGSRIRFTLAGGNLMVDNAMIETADIETSNGVIHVIDSVILP